MMNNTSSNLKQTRFFGVLFCFHKVHGIIWISTKRNPYFSGCTRNPIWREVPFSFEKCEGHLKLRLKLRLGLQIHSKRMGELVLRQSCDYRFCGFEPRELKLP
jgi:hypothetical protein